MKQCLAEQVFRFPNDWWCWALNHFPCPFVYLLWRNVTSKVWASTIFLHPQILFLCEMRKDLNHKMGEMCIRLCGGVVEVRVRSHRARGLSLWLCRVITPALACRHVLFRTFWQPASSCLRRETRQGMWAITLQMSLVSECSHFCCTHN